MPIYEYACRKCGARTEALQKISDKPLTKCKACGGKLEKQWSQTSFQLKGSGWYVTDYAAKKTDAKESGATDNAATSENKSGGDASTSETKSGETSQTDAKTTDTKAADTKTSDAGGNAKTDGASNKKAKKSSPANPSRKQEG